MTETTPPPTDDAIERLTFEEALALYERGVALQQRCDRLLRDAELRVQQLVARAGGVLQAQDVRPDEAREAPEDAEA